MSITTQELAEICNVSRGTVDRALNNRPGVSARTKQLILKTARECGYMPHLLASSLATGKTRTIGIIVFDLENRFFSQMVSAIQQRCLEYGYFCYVCMSNKDQEQEKKLIENLMQRKADGLILVSVNQGDAFCESLRRWEKPVVTVNNRLDDSFSFVGGNGSEAVYAGMELFYEKGYRDMVFLCPPYRRRGQENLYAQEVRVEGFRRFLTDHPQMRGELVVEKDYIDHVLQLIRASGEKKLGVFCASDHYALRLYKAAREQGLRAPRDFGLMGFDGIDMLDYFDQRITTVFYPSEKIGQLSADCLFRMIDGGESCSELLECPMILGETI